MTTINRNTDMTALIKYNAARLALSEARAVDEVKDIRDKAEAMAAYARQAKDTELVQWATEIKVRAERRAGQMLAEMPKAKGELKNSSRSHDSTATKTLAEIGISKNESSRWQKLAAVTEDQFEHAVAAAKEVAGEVTTAAMLRAAKADEPAKEKPAKKAKRTVETQPENVPTFEDGKVESAHVIESLSAENDALRDRLAVEVMDCSEEEKTLASQTIAELRLQVKNLSAELAAVKSSRDTYMREAGEAKKEAVYWRKQADKLAKVAA